MKHLLSSAIFILLATLLLPVLPCSAARTYGPDDPLIAVIPADYPPTYFKETNSDKPLGLAVDVMEDIARRDGIPVRHCHLMRRTCC